MAFSTAFLVCPEVGREQEAIADDLRSTGYTENAPLIWSVARQDFESEQNTDLAMCSQGAVFLDAGMEFLLRLVRRPSLLRHTLRGVSDQSPQQDHCSGDCYAGVSGYCHDDSYTVSSDCGPGRNA